MESLRKLSDLATPSGAPSRARLSRGESRVRPQRRALPRGRSALLPPPPQAAPRRATTRSANVYLAELVEELPEAPAQVQSPAPAPKRPVIRHATETRIPAALTAAPPARVRASLSPGERSEIGLPHELQLAWLRWPLALAFVAAVWNLIS